MFDKEEEEEEENHYMPDVTPTRELRRAEPVENNRLFDELTTQIAGVDRFIGAQVYKHDYFMNQSVLLEEDDLRQIALLSLFTSFKKMRTNAPEWESFIQPFRQKHNIDDIHFEASKTKIFLGWAKSQIRWDFLDEAQKAMGEANTVERAQNPALRNETDIQQPNNDKDESFFDQLTVSADIHPDAIHQQTIDDFEHFFGVQISLDTLETTANHLRGALYKTVRNLLQERKTASGSGPKPTDIEIWAFEAYFVEHKPFTIKADETGAKLNSLTHAIPRIINFLFQNKDTIRERVKAVIT